MDNENNGDQSQTSNHINELNQQHLQDGHHEDTSDIIHFSWTQLSEIKEYKYNNTNILLKTGSTLSVFKNPDMLLNIRSSGRTLKAYTNDGRQDSTQVADLPGFFTVWFNPPSMINILSWADVSRKFRITTDTSIGQYITVYLSDQRKMNFEEVSTGLYLFWNKAHIMSKNPISGYSYLILTEANMNGFNKQ